MPLNQSRQIFLFQGLWRCRMWEATQSNQQLPSENNQPQLGVKTMQNQNFVQLELPLTAQKNNPFKQVEEAIQNMLGLTWQCVLGHISARTTKELMRQHGKLVAISDGQAIIKLSSAPVLRIAHEKLPDVEAAFKKAFGCSIKVSLEV
jgi:hypothetical protein